MLNRILKVLKWFLAILMLFLVIIISLIRFTDGTISMSNKIILGYDEEMNRFQFFEKKTYNLSGIDGPYIIGNKLYSVNSDNNLDSIILNRIETLTVKVDNVDNDHFNLNLKDSIHFENDSYQMPDKLIAISDIEGNFDGFVSFLMANKVIDSTYNWIFDKGHLVLNGDLVDRGSNVTQVLWLVYKLEDQAKTKGGKVHYILGNHEVMNMEGNASYNKSKYKKVAQLISKEEDISDAVRFMYSQNSELGKWLQHKNVIEKIGNYVFVHGGLSPKILDYDISISEINDLARKYWLKNFTKDTMNQNVEEFIVGKEGVYWFRGLAIETENYSKVISTELDKILEQYNATKIIFGHTIMEEITKDYQGKTINIDVKHGQKKYSGMTKGILIQNGYEYIINDKGHKKLF
jgi:Calcineurin-like phosphoesterase